MNPLSHKKTLLILLLIGLSLPPAKAYGWGNGSSGSTRYPYYGVHDVIADITYQKLRDYNATTASWITEYYLNLSGSKLGDYQYSFSRGADNWLSYADDPDSYYMDWKNHLYEVHGAQRGAPERVKQCYDWIVANLTKWMTYGRIVRPIPADIYANAPPMLMASEYEHKAAYAAGLLTHYFSDLSQFGHTDNTTKDHTHPVSYDPEDRTYHGYYESSSVSESLLDRMLADLGGYTFKVDKRIGNVERTIESFARWVNAHDNSSALYTDVSGKVVIVGSTYKQLLTEFVSNYDNGLSYYGARGYNASLYGSTMLHISAAVGNITQLLYSAYKDAEEKAAIIEKSRVPTNISLDLPSTSIRIGETLSLGVALSTWNGSGVKGQTVYLSIVENDTSIAKQATILGSAIMNVSGKASWQYSDKLKIGAYKLVAQYIGNETYGLSYASKAFAIRLTSTSLSLTVTPTVQGKATTFKAALMDESGRPIKDASIDFYLGDASRGSAKTNSEGIATLAFTSSQPGTFQVRARYGGGDVYSGSQSEPATLEIYIDYTPYAVAGLIAIVLLIVILLIKRRY